MAINIFKALSNISTILVTSAVLTLPTVNASYAGGNSSDPQDDPMIVDSGFMLGICFLDGGTVTTSPNGDNHCYNPKTGKTTECSGPNGSPDACWTEGRPTGGKFGKTAVRGGDIMIMQPDTNTTVGTGAKPLGGKLSMQNVLRN